MPATGVRPHARLVTSPILLNTAGDFMRRSVSSPLKFVVPVVSVIVFASVMLLYAATGVITSFTPAGATYSRANAINLRNL